MWCAEGKFPCQATQKNSLGLIRHVAAAKMTIHQNDTLNAKNEYNERHELFTVRAFQIDYLYQKPPRVKSNLKSIPLVAIYMGVIASSSVTSLTTRISAFVIIIC